MIDAFSCDMCGYGGLTNESHKFEHGDIACPRCGYRHWSVAAPDDVGYFDDDRDVAQSPLASSPTVAFWSQFS